MPRRIEDDAIDALFDYPWPGNVRQLRHVVEKLVVGTLGDSLINADAVRRALDNHPHVVLCSTNGRWPFAAYAEGDSLDDFLDHAMLDLYEMLRERRAAIPRLPANCELTAVRFINAWTVLVEDSIFRLSTRPRQALFRLLVWLRKGKQLKGCLDS